MSNFFGQNINSINDIGVKTNNPSTSGRKSENRIKTLMENKLRNNINPTSPIKNIRSSFAEETVILQSFNNSYLIF